MMMNNFLQKNQTRFLIWLSFFFLCFGVVSTNLKADENSLNFEQLLREKLLQPSLQFKEQKITLDPTLIHLYQENKYKPFWTKRKRLSKYALEFIEYLDQVQMHGLKGTRYSRNLIHQIAKKKKKKLSIEKQVTLDILLTQGYIQLATDLHYGMVHFATGDPIANKDQKRFKMATDFLEVKDKERVRFLESLPPQTKMYKQLSQYLLNYKPVKPLTEFAFGRREKIKKGISNPRIASIKRYLHQLGYLDNARKDRNKFDDKLEVALKNFQKDYGLLVDGVIGPATVATMRMTDDQKICKISVNLDRMRSFPKTWGEKAIVVNIPDFRLRVLENDQEVMQMKVIVGRKKRPTPIFSHQMSYMVFNPFWYVPRKLAIKDILPKVKKDPEFLQRQGIRVFQAKPNKKHAELVDPAEIDWQNQGKEGFRLSFVQSPGHRNALGNMKFMFPNKHAVYLHDTPQRYLFKRHQRAYSSGCVRVEKPNQLADYVLQDLNEEEIQEIVDNRSRKVVKMEEKIPIHIIYQTAWVNDQNKVQFRGDIYGLDKEAAKHVCP